MRIEGAVALVTGANRGLGRAFVEGMLAAGARKVYAAVREPDRIAIPGVEKVRLDVTRPDEVAAAAARCGDVTLLVNNAGILQPSALLAAGGLDAARAQLETNFFGTLAMCSAFAPVLGANGGGAVINVLSALTWFSLPTTGTYGASKAAAWALTNGIRNELRGQGTRVLALHSAFIDTDMAKSVAAPKSTPEDVVRQTLEALAAGSDEVLTDETTRLLKRGLNAEPPAYTRASLS
ncbi:SDR family oxidoreductase [Vulgatibacter sp.]|uniref:SDR family oxidoreductase n=1 Tax=Vulgatibacter sp. TaxID=1971226 RepID=UPI00356800CA